MHLDKVYNSCQLTFDTSSIFSEESPLWDVFESLASIILSFFILTSSVKFSVFISLSQFACWLSSEEDARPLKVVWFLAISSRNSSSSDSILKFVLIG